MDYGRLELNIDRILKERGISKIRYVGIWIYQEPTLTDTATTIFIVWMPGLICKLCHYLDIEVGELITYKRAD